MLKDLGDGKVATKIPVKFLGKKEYLVKLKPKQRIFEHNFLKFVHIFLITQKSISHFFLSLDILTDKKMQNWLKKFYFAVETT